MDYLKKKQYCVVILELSILLMCDPAVIKGSHSVLASLFNVANNVSGWTSFKPETTTMQNITHSANHTSGMHLYFYAFFIH